MLRRPFASGPLGWRCAGMMGLVSVHVAYPSICACLWPAPAGAGLLHNAQRAMRRPKTAAAWPLTCRRQTAIPTPSASPVRRIGCGCVCSWPENTETPAPDALPVPLVLTLDDARGGSPHSNEYRARRRSSAPPSTCSVAAARRNHEVWQFARAESSGESRATTSDKATGRRQSTTRKSPTRPLTACWGSMCIRR